MDKSGNTLTALQVTLWPSGASGEDKTAHTSVPLTPHKAFRKLAAMHLNRYIIIMAVTSEPVEWGRGLCCLWSGGGASAAESRRPRTVDSPTESPRSRQTFYYPSLCAPRASVPVESVAPECGRRHSGGGLIHRRSVVRGRKKQASD